MMHDDKQGLRTDGIIGACLETSGCGCHRTAFHQIQMIGLLSQPANCAVHHNVLLLGIQLQPQLCSEIVLGLPALATSCSDPTVFTDLPGYHCCYYS